jgi:ubiquinone/menaquinone biosynthesis C-methylase UbiE
MARTSREEYAGLAAGYDRRWAAYVERSLALLRPHVEGAELGVVLDLGCGTGSLLLRLAAWRAYVARYVGVDASPEMLAVARTKLIGGAALTAGDVAALPLAEGRFDTVISASSLHDWPDPRRALDEARRVLRPGGRLLLLDWCGDGLTMKAFDGWMRLTGKSYQRMYDSAEARQMLESARFHVTSSERRPINLPWQMMLFDCRAF